MPRKAPGTRRVLIALFCALMLPWFGRCTPSPGSQEGPQESSSEGTHRRESAIEQPATGESCLSDDACHDGGSSQEGVTNEEPSGRESTAGRENTTGPDLTGSEAGGTEQSQGQDAGADEGPGVERAPADAGVADRGQPPESTADRGQPPESTADTGQPPENKPLPLGALFRYGINLGHHNKSWGDDKHGLLAAQAGANSTRKKLPEYHLERWGYKIEVNDLKYYDTLKMRDHVGFLIGVTAAHSTKPASEPDWKLDYYIPKNLYKATLVNGKINPENYWGHYVYKTVSEYKGWIKIWEVWNEPDWVSNWQVTQTWTTTPPKASDLPRFNGSIFDYIRLLRVTREAARLADPKALIALGGIGYPSFLSAILRYTDNPQGGSVSAAYPQKGGAYFDVLNVHYYPVYFVGNSDASVDGFVKKKTEMQAQLTKAGITRTFVWNATETGAPHHKITGRPGGNAYARNYLMKVMVLAQKIGFRGVDWYTLSDYGEVGKSTDPYAFMGLYQDIAQLTDTAQAKKTETGWAYKTLAGLLKGARYDPNVTAALKLPTQVEGAAFRLPNGRNAYVLWAYNPKASDEGNKASFTLQSSRSLREHAWDYSRTQNTTTRTPSQGKLTLQLSSSPLIFVEQ